MKTTFRSSIVILIVFTICLSACKQEDQPAPDLSGNYTFESATLLDGNILDLNSSDLVILNATTDPDATPPNSLTIEKDESAFTSDLVEVMLGLSAPCTDPILSNWKYAINFETDNTLAFICSSENDKSDDVGDWALEDGNNTLILDFRSGLFEEITSVPIKLKDVTFADGKIKGTIKSFPMIKDFDKNVNDISNIQLISFDIVLRK